MSGFESLGSGGDNQLPPQPFANYALEYYQLGLSIIPCFDKKPAIKSWTKYQTSKPTRREVENWIRRFPKANIGIVTGAVSNITVIDCDNLNLSIEELEAEFGESYFIVTTPRGGKHLYFRHSGEAKKTSFDSRKIDLIGKGSYITAPQSFNSETGKPYKIIRGNLSNLTNLSRLKVDLTFPESPKVVSASKNKYGENSCLQIEEGERNTYLFNQLRREAKSCGNYNSLEEKALLINNVYLVKPLDEAEVIGTAKKVWEYKVTGTLISGNEGFVLMRVEEMEALTKFPNAYMVLSKLRYYHDGLKRDFCIDQIKTSKKFGLSRKTLKKVIDVLIEKKFLFRRKNKPKKICKDGQIKTSPYFYSLCRG